MFFIYVGLYLLCISITYLLGYISIMYIIKFIFYNSQKYIFEFKMNLNSRSSEHFTHNTFDTLMRSLNCLYVK